MALNWKIPKKGEICGKWKTFENIYGSLKAHLLSMTSIFFISQLIWHRSLVYSSRGKTRTMLPFLLWLLVHQYNSITKLVCSKSHKALGFSTNIFFFQVAIYKTRTLKKRRNFLLFLYFMFFIFFTRRKFSFKNIPFNLFVYVVVPLARK